MRQCYFDVAERSLLGLPLSNGCKCLEIQQFLAHTPFCCMPGRSLAYRRAHCGRDGETEEQTHQGNVPAWGKYVVSVALSQPSQLRITQGWQGDNNRNCCQPRSRAAPRAHSSAVLNITHATKQLKAGASCKMFIHVLALTLIFLLRCDHIEEIPRRLLLSPLRSSVS